MTMLDDKPVALDETETGEEPPPPDGPPSDHGDTPFRRWRANLPLILVIVLAWTVAAGGVVLWKQNQDLRADRDDERAAERVAADFTTAVLSYNFRDLRGSVDDVKALSTTDWGRQYEEAWFQEQQSIVEATRARGRVAVEDVLLGEESSGVIPAVVRFDATIRSEVGVRRITGGYLQLDLTRQDGEWKVDAMQYLATEDQQLDPADGSGGGDGTAPTATTTP
jgi:hypothetical protein